MNRTDGRGAERVIPLIIHSILSRRGLSEAEIDEFVYPDYASGIGDPYLMSGMREAVARLLAARDKDEMVVVYGDYDIDGITASAVMLEVLEANGLRCRSYIPDRFEEGYGLNVQALEQIRGDGVDLVVSVDCGITSVEEADWARAHGLDLIITDHHSVPAKLPEAVAVINPKQPGDKYPFKDLAGVGVAFKLACALQAETGKPAFGQEKWWLDLVALGTVCDVVPLVGENRILASFGIRVLRRTKRLGIIALAESAGVRVPDLASYHLGYVLGPRMNAAGRLEHAGKSLELVRTGEMRRGQTIAAELESLNRQRRTDQDRIFAEAKHQVEAYSSSPVLIVASDSWSHGVVGIVASKLAETFHKPVLVGQVLGEVVKGSARSVSGFNIVEALRANEALLDRFGGHFFAAGFTLPASNLEALRDGMARAWQAQAVDTTAPEQVEADGAVMNLSEVDIELLEQLELLEPHGSGNPRPRFVLPGVVIGDIRPVGAEGKHLKLTFIDGEGERIGAIGFGLAERYTDLAPGQVVTAVGELSQNEWQGVVSPQVVVREIHS